MTKDLNAYVIIATKGRPDDVARLADLLNRQTIKPKSVIFVGTGSEDFGKARTAKNSMSTEYLISEKAGLPAQRNVGLEHTLESNKNNDNFVIVYFDDDFRPRDNWIENALAHFSNTNTAALTGVVLADGINGPGIPEEEAELYLNSKLPPDLKHWTAKQPDQEIRSTYGCNMAFSAKASRNLRFDEALPAYAWQEDRDYSRRASKYGKVWCLSSCLGVHLGTKRGRVSGVKFGYSQIANPFYLSRKGTMRFSEVLNLIFRNMAANHAKMFFPEDWVDRIGRVKGNWIAIGDLFKKKISPDRINSL